jgi:hypothetical protein
MSALERSKAELALYREQLGQINALVASDPANAQFLKLQADLHQVIALTVDLIAVAEAAKEKEATSSSGAYDPLSATDADFQADVDDLGQEDDEDEKGVEAFGVGSTVEALSGTSWYPAVIKSVSEDGQVRHKYTSHSRSVCGILALIFCCCCFCFAGIFARLHWIFRRR